MGLYQIKKAAHKKINKMKKEPTVWENIFTNDV